MSGTENWRPTAEISNLRARARLLQSVRQYFSEREVMEVETPLISAAGNTDPEINSILTSGGRFLRTSPEFALKRLLAAGSGDVFEMGRVFRSGESGRNHNPEFTMLEWYRTGFSYQQLMFEVIDLVRKCGLGKFDHWPEERLTFKQLFQRHLNLDPFTAEVSDLSAAAKQHDIDDIDLTRNQWLDLLLSLVIQPNLPDESFTLICDYPADQAALARIRHGTPPVAERFELYLGRNELANGYQELTDADEQKQRFDSENEQRKTRGEPCYPIDENLIAAMTHGLPECSGVALGLDRLLMSICDAITMEDVISFPDSRA